MKTVWADGAYRGPLVEEVAAETGWALTIIERPKADENGDPIKRFKLLPKRWVVERTFGWLIHFRRLARNYERLSATEESDLYAAISHLMLRRLTTLAEAAQGFPDNL